MEMLQAQNDSSRVYIGADEMGGTGIGDPDPDVAAVSAAATGMAASVVAGGDRIACKVIPATNNKIPAVAPARCRHIACSSFDLTRARAKGGSASRRTKLGGTGPLSRRSAISASAPSAARDLSGA